MNAGTDYRKARAHAQANADRDGQPRVLNLYNGIWWIDRLDSFSITDTMKDPPSRLLPQGAEIIQPRPKKD